MGYPVREVINQRNRFAWAQNEKAYEDHFRMMAFLKVDPRLDGLHSEPRYTDLVRRVSLPPSERILTVPFKRLSRTCPVCAANRVASLTCLRLAT